MSSDDQSSDDDASSSIISSDASSEAGGLVDLEAQESASSGESEDEDDAPEHTFAKFTQLPPELRLRVWQLFCADLVARARVLQFSLSASSAAMRRPDHHSVKDHLTLADQTEALRIVMATHRESRSFAAEKYPDELGMDAGSGDAVVRFSRRADVVILRGLTTGRRYLLPGFAERVRNLGVVPDTQLEEAAPFLAGVFRNVARLYVIAAAEAESSARLRWCVTDYVHRYVVETYEKQPGLGEDTQSVFCWPDVDRHADFANYSLPRHLPRGQCAFLPGLETWPMVEFELESGVARYAALRKMKHTPLGVEDLHHGDGSDSDDEDSSEQDGGDGDSQDGEGTDLDEYESEGIDDGEIEIYDSGDSSEVETEPGDAGRFSSPEADDGGGAAPAPVPRSRKRKVVVDSDEDEQGDEPEMKRARRTGVGVVSDDEHGDGAGAEMRRGREKQVYSGGGSEDEGGQAEQPVRPSLAERLERLRQERVLSSASEEDDGEDDEDEDEEDEGEDDEEDDEDEDEDDEDDEEDDEEDEDEDEDQDQDNDGLLNIMAEEGSDDEQDQSDEGW
ncbi:uncharacterized protein UV8b_04758 [Ustilaginoidea virens]|uniref:2EXR domain-containing protein n=1 Tax=Ustilaginoidea virens TaxID=1159556 RepID=A0A063BP66_USTVR|nr:uncharacterized protein UV8b_04758 [Ustilaginoidea virens]QUC20517.1 hypothetical protein UV8b_04758 [Ustilaginoidea virens]GAO15587.1 hypothetical protein UVI_02050200 [Ustilaginoidea virens]